MDHIIAWPLLDTYLDCGVDAETRLAVTEHLADCRTCQTYLAGQARLRLAMRARLNTVKTPHGLATQIHTRLLAESGPSTPSSTPSPSRQGKILALGAIFAVLTLMVIGWLVLRPGPPNQGLVRELAVQYAVFGQDEKALEITGSPAAVTAWFQTRVPLSIDALQFSGYVLQGGRLAVVNEQRAAQLVYQREGTEEYISLFYYVAPPNEAASSTPEGYAARRFGDLSVVAWSEEATQAALVADLPENTLLDLARDRR